MILLEKGEARHDALLDSALTLQGVYSEADLLAWLTERSAAYEYCVERIQLESLLNWSVDPVSGDLSHSSGKFFRVTGLEIEINDVSTRQWSQPIVVQPEVGILGFIAKRINDVLHLLVQAKMEPGNINMVQISPTVQATRSNYLQVHGGRRPPFIEYFIETGRGITLLDQLQSEQGARYLRKRNRNMIVQVDDDETIPESEDFRWVTLGQLHQLHRFENLVHLDSRSILGSLTLRPAAIAAADDASAFGADVLTSLACSDTEAEHTLSAVLGWLTRVKTETDLHTQVIPLHDVAAWQARNGLVEHELGRFFQVIGVEVRASSREVASWNQPLIKNVDGGLLGLLVQKRGDVMHFLVQARVEPGFIDAVELAPTVQCCPVNYGSPLTASLPPFVEVFDRLNPEQLRVSTMLSDEGGRFYHSQLRHVVAELCTGKQLKLPHNYCWMTLAQLHACARFSNMLNIELRSVLSCIPLV
ncbi:NDP-hexose 2,3-dehydratase family protein [bacterium]|nr:NDP-hexose 2,3-dehydratase family protein [bacterium]